MQRRSLLGAAALSLLPASRLQAQALPQLRMFVPANPGGGWDSTGHALGHALVAAGQASDVTYENKGGKGGVIGLAQFVERHASDPSALMVGGYVMVGSIALNRPAVDLSKVTPIARLTSELLVLVVPAASRYRKVGDVLNDLKTKPAAVSVGGGGAGGVDHMFAAMMVRAAGLDPTSLVYKPFSSGADVLAALAAGQLSAAVSGYGEFKDAIAAGTVRALGISSKRASYGIASLTEQGVKVELANWRGVFAGAALSEPQAAALRDAVQRATLHASWKDALARNSWQSAWATGREFREAIELDESLARVMVHLLHLKA
ncbi:MAG TPA: tripartite tricarboxylate transporter substrate-binding protein [Burkholderiaceae bacterium]|nr:tripartite tricarboxylate transporter substrate-binding protein [Burkholderiaceae bacterium]